MSHLSPRFLCLALVCDPDELDEHYVIVNLEEVRESTG